MSLKAGRWALLLLALLCIPSLGEFRSISSIQRAQKDYLYDQLERLDPKADQLFVIWDSAFPFEYLDPFDGLSELPERFNLFSLATFQRAPLSREILERFKIKDLLEGIVDNPSAFMICTGHHGYLYWNYMKEKHGVKIRAEKVFECQYFKVFKIRSKPPNDRGPDLGRKGLVEGGKESF